MIEARELHTVSEIVANRKAVRAYFRTLPAWEPPKPVWIPPPPPPVVEEEPTPTAPLFRVPVKFSTRIINATCDYYELTREEMLGPSRQPIHVRPRWVAMWICSRLGRMSHCTIGTLFKRDHSTVIHGIRAVKRDLDRIPGLAAKIAAIIETIG